MPNFGMFPQTQTLVSGAAITQTGTSAALTLPSASSYRFIIICNSVSGTTPTLQVQLATSFDGGTTYVNIASIAQITTTGTGRQFQFRPYLGTGDQVTQSFACTLLGTAELASSDSVVNGPINPQFIKFRYVVGGSTPSLFTTIGVIAVPQDLSD